MTHRITNLRDRLGRETIEFQELLEEFEDKKEHDLDFNGYEKRIDEANVLQYKACFILGILYSLKEIIRAQKTPDYVTAKRVLAELDESYEHFKSMSISFSQRASNITTLARVKQTVMPEGGSW